MISLSLYLQHKDDEHNAYSVEAKRDNDGDLRISFHRRVDYWSHQDVGVYLRPDLACQLRDRLNVLFPMPEPELLAPSVPIHEQKDETV